jgi:hypothetical protein
MRKSMINEQQKAMIQQQKKSGFVSQHDGVL